MCYDGKPLLYYNNMAINMLLQWKQLPNKVCGDKNEAEYDFFGYVDHGRNFIIVVNLTNSRLKQQLQSGNEAEM